MIVGIDPGQTSAIACVDLDGKLLYAAHKTFAGTEWMIKAIRGVGVPVLIAADKSRLNENVRRIGAAFNARIFCPGKDMTIEEKREMSKSIEMKSRHEQDAYAAAMKAYNSHSNKLRQAEHAVSNTQVDRDTVKARVINRYSIREAVLNRNPNRK